MIVDTLTVKLEGDARDLEQGLDRSRGKFLDFKNVVTGMAQGVGIAVAGMAINGAKAVVQFGADSITAASDLNETLSKTNVLFGDSADAVVEFADTASTKFGQSKQQALDAAATFATFGRAAGLAGTDLVDFSTDFVGLASDLASFNNTTPEQAIQAIGAALRGESEPLRQYGVLLDAATLEQHALALGIWDGEGALSAQQKVLAAQAAIYAQTGAAQGDFARTSDGLANQQRILDAQMQNLKATIGQALLPVVLSIVQKMNEFATAVLPPLAAFIQNTLAPAMTRVAGVITSVLGPAMEFITGLFKSTGDSVKATAEGPFSEVREWFVTNMPLIQETVRTVLQWIQDFWAAHGETIMTVVSNTFTTISTVIDTVLMTILDLIRVVMQLITGDWEGAWETIQGIVERIWDAIVTIATTQLDSIWTLISGFGGDMLRAGGEWVSSLWDGIAGAWTGMIEDVRGKLRELRDLLPFSEPKDSASPLRGLGRSGEAIVRNIQEGLDRMTFNIDTMAAPVGAGAFARAGAGAGPISIHIEQTFTGRADAEVVRSATEGGVLAALRQVGLR